MHSEERRFCGVLSVRALLFIIAVRTSSKFKSPWQIIWIGSGCCKDQRKKRDCQLGRGDRECDKITALKQIIEDYDPSDISNIDETGLLFKFVPCKAVFLKI